MCQVSFDAFRGDLIFRAKVSKSFNEPEFAKMTKEKRAKVHQKQGLHRGAICDYQMRIQLMLLSKVRVFHSCIREGINKFNLETFIEKE